jgi:hypothetical protein
MLANFLQSVGGLFDAGVISFARSSPTKGAFNGTTDFLPHDKD